MVGPEHIGNRDPLRDTDNQGYGRIGGFHYCIGGKGRRHKIGGSVGAGLLPSLADGIEYRHAFKFFPAPAGVDNTDHLGPVLEHLPHMKGGLAPHAFAARIGLYQHLCVLVY